VLENPASLIPPLAVDTPAKDIGRPVSRRALACEAVINPTLPEMLGLGCRCLSLGPPWSPFWLLNSCKGVASDEPGFAMVPKLRLAVSLPLPLILYKLPLVEALRSKGDPFNSV